MPAKETVYPRLGEGIKKELEASDVRQSELIRALGGKWKYTAKTGYEYMCGVTKRG